MDLKVDDPKNYRAVLKEIKKGRVKKGDIAEQFKDININHILDTMSERGVILRSVEHEGDKLKIYIECSKETPSFKQGRNKYPKKIRGEIL